MVRKMKKERLYAVWQGMKRRCNNPSNNSFNDYGGRGISVCEEWENNYECFKTWALSNGYDPTAKQWECTLDRIDNDGNYEPNNCRWVPLITQANNKRNNKFYTCNGETKTLSEWARNKGLSVQTLHSRINRYGYSIEEALSLKPLKERKRNNLGRYEKH